MKGIASIGITVALVATLAGCGSWDQRDRNTAIGAGVGAVGGNVITGGSTLGTVGGAVVGGAVGRNVK